MIQYFIFFFAPKKNNLYVCFIIAIRSDNNKAFINKIKLKLMVILRASKKKRQFFWEINY